MKTSHQRHAFNVAQLKPLAKRIEKSLDPATHFALVIFDQELVGQEVVRREGDAPAISSGGYTSYISNAERASMVLALRECAENLERGLDMPGVHPDRAKGN